MNIETLSPFILTLVTFVPGGGALLLGFFPCRNRDVRLFVLAVSLLAFIVSLHLPAHVVRSQPGFQFEVNEQWISSANIHYYMGVDGFSMWLVVLSTCL